MKTFSAKPESVKRDWLIIDASGKVLGRLASEVAHRLRGKHKAEFTPHVDTGDYIVVINAEKILTTGKKETDKFYHSYSGYQSGLKSISAKDMRKRAPERMIEEAVRGMLPKNPLGRDMFRKLKVYRGAAHKHQAQNPKTLELR
jgi:large subunit ribosomal protein L13